MHFDYLNTQDQPKIVWPPSFPLVRAYLDQLTRSNGLPAAKISALRTALAGAEKLSGGQKRTALQQVAADAAKDAAGSSDQAKVHMLSAAEMKDHGPLNIKQVE